MRKRRELIRLLSDEKIKEAEKFLKKNSKYCLSMQAMALHVLKYALDRKQFKVCALLNARGFTLNFEKEGIGETYRKLPKDELTQLQNEVRKLYVPSAAYLKLQTDMTPLVKKLMLKTKMASKNKSMENFQELRESYEHLEAIEEIRPILVIAADSELLQIVCGNGSTDSMLPGMSFSCGSCDYDNHTVFATVHIFPNEGMGILIHEFIHYIMVVIYENKYLPFTRHDSQRKEEYLKAYDSCEIESRSDANRDLKHLSIFSFKDEKKTPERIEAYKRLDVITLPPTIPIIYTGETEMRYRQCLAPLFEFYKKYTLPDIIKKSQEIEAKQRE